MENDIEDPVAHPDSRSEAESEGEEELLMANQPAAQKDDTNNSEIAMPGADTGGSDHNRRSLSRPHQNRNNNILQNVRRNPNFDADHESKDDDHNIIGTNEDTSTNNQKRFDNLARDFDPNDLAPKLSTRDTFEYYWLRLKAIMPLLVALSMIYYITGVYIFTYCIGLISDDWNNKSNFFHHDPDDLPGLRKMPKALR